MPAWDSSRISNRPDGLAEAQHLGQALREYAGAANKERRLALLLPVQRAAERCAWLKHMVEARLAEHLRGLLRCVNMSQGKCEYFTAKVD